MPFRPIYPGLGQAPNNAGLHTRWNSSKKCSLVLCGEPMYPMLLSGHTGSLLWSKLHTDTLPLELELCPKQRPPFQHTHTRTHARTHTHPYNGPFSGTTRVSRYQKGKTNLDFTGARDSEWQWHQLGHMQDCTSLQTDNYASTPPLSFLQAGCPSCRPTNSVKALKAVLSRYSVILLPAPALLGLVAEIIQATGDIGTPVDFRFM